MDFKIKWINNSGNMYLLDSFSHDLRYTVEYGHQVVIFYMIHPCGPSF